MKNVEKIGKMIYDILHSEEFKERHRMQEKDFTRKRKMGFAQVSTERCQKRLASRNNRVFG